MQTKPGKKQPRQVLALDCDKLGLLGGMTLATVVMAVSFYREVSILEAVFRATVTFLVGYVAVFILTRTILHTALSEFVRAREEEPAVEESETQAEGSGETE
ncbi:MAG: hypothetical protein JXR94_08125 [Candidatus Hydrogenedentes bacterium]|nr:hypothetical protein [Candidatus Hydrogenedentota bacterium]